MRMRYINLYIYITWEIWNSLESVNVRRVLLVEFVANVGDLSLGEKMKKKDSFRDPAIFSSISSGLTWQYLKKTASASQYCSPRSRRSCAAVYWGIPQRACRRPSPSSRRHLRCPSAEYSVSCRARRVPRCSDICPHRTASCQPLNTFRFNARNPRLFLRKFSKQSDNRRALIDAFRATSVMTQQWQFWPYFPPF